MPDYRKIEQLRQLREMREVTQVEMAQFFGFTGRSARNRMRAWESGNEIPPLKHRETFISYLVERLALETDRETFHKLWQALCQEWHWPELSASEQKRYFKIDEDLLTRNVGVWLWDNYGKDIIEILAKRTSITTKEVITGRWQRFDWRQASQDYQREMKSQYATMRVLGMTDPVSLSGIYTDVYVLDKPSAWRRHSIQELIDRAILEDDILSVDTRQNSLDVVKAKQRVFILGKPGAGKTTLLKYLVLQSVEEKLDSIPIFVSLKAWSDSKLKLMTYLANQFKMCSFPNPSEFIEYILTEGKAIVLFDGLDEINQEYRTRENVIQSIQDFTNQWC